MNRARFWLRQAAYRSGALALMSGRLGVTLTVVMFHRVLDPADRDFADADPGNTVSAPLFEEALEFFCEHYAVVSLADLFAAAEGERPLPNHSLLISFDDGWADNLRYAAPLLKARGLPAVVFIAADPVLSPAANWWQQQVFDAARLGTLAAALERFPITGTIAAADRENPLDVVCRLADLGENERAQILEAIPARTCVSRMMLAPNQLSSLETFGIALGIHGWSHLPLTQVTDIHSELGRARSMVASLSTNKENASALACPHGRYDQRVLTASREAGIRLVFTSDPVLNRLDRGMVAPGRVLGRISMEAPHLVDRFGRLDRSAAAAWLWRRPVSAISQHSTLVSNADHR